MLVAFPLMRRGTDMVLLSSPRFTLNPPLIRALLQDRAVGMVGLVFLCVGFAFQFLAQIA